MQVQVIENYHGYDSHRPIFPTFLKGTLVEITGEMDNDFRHWYPSVIAGYETFVPTHFVKDGRLIKDYNPTELSQKIGDILMVVEVANAWLLAINSKGVTGWIAAEAVISVEPFDYRAFLTNYWHRNGKCIGDFFHKDALSFLHDSNEVLTREHWIDHYKEPVDGWHTTIDRIENLGNNRYMTITFHRSPSWNGFVTSIFIIRDGLIRELNEYYSPCDDNIVPQWRGD